MMRLVHMIDHVIDFKSAFAAWAANLQLKIFDTLLRFRLNPIGIISDIK